MWSISNVARIILLLLMIVSNVYYSMSNINILCILYYYQCVVNNDINKCEAHLII